MFKDKNIYHKLCLLFQFKSELKVYTFPKEVKEEEIYLTLLLLLDLHNSQEETQTKLFQRFKAINYYFQLFKRLLFCLQDNYSRKPSRKSFFFEWVPQKIRSKTKSYSLQGEKKAMIQSQLFIRNFKKLRWRPL